MGQRLQKWAMLRVSVGDFRLCVASILTPSSVGSSRHPYAASQFRASPILSICSSTLSDGDAPTKYDTDLDPGVILDPFLVDDWHSAYEGDANYDDYEELDECGVRDDLAPFSASEADLLRDYSSSIPDSLKRACCMRNLVVQVCPSCHRTSAFTQNYHM